MQPQYSNEMMNLPDLELCQILLQTQVQIIC